MDKDSLVHILNEWFKINIKNGIYPSMRGFRFNIKAYLAGRPYNNEVLLSEHLDLANYYFKNNEHIDSLKMALMFRNSYHSSLRESHKTMPLSLFCSHLAHFSWFSKREFGDKASIALVAMRNRMYDLFNPIFDERYKNVITEPSDLELAKIGFDIINHDLAEQDYFEYEKRVRLLRKENSHISDEDYYEKRMRYIEFMLGSEDSIFSSDVFKSKTEIAVRNLKQEYIVLRDIPKYYFHTFEKVK